MSLLLQRLVPTSHSQIASASSMFNLLLNEIELLNIATPTKVSKSIETLLSPPPMGVPQPEFRSERHGQFRREKLLTQSSSNLFLKNQFVLALFLHIAIQTKRIETLFSSFQTCLPTTVFSSLYFAISSLLIFSISLFISQPQLSFFFQFRNRWHHRIRDNAPFQHSKLQVFFGTLESSRQTVSQTHLALSSVALCARFSAVKGSRFFLLWSCNAQSLHYTSVQKRRILAIAAQIRVE